MSTKNPFDPAAMSDNVKAQAQQIWLAGLGAFAKAQEDGTKAFEKLVSDGISMQRKVHTTAEEKLAEATKKATQAAHTLSERATGQWGKLEGIFEDRVAKALHSLGLPSAAQMEALHARVATLEAQLGQGKTKTTAARAAKPSTKTAAKPAVKKAPAKKAAKK
ncbi:phasin family protein [Limnohabitans sp.]|uniref:phasin family protein n=1 Tax=Limnohabitans sp. TaxID=1907725 RepID=UPI00286ED0C9|nr:phasin family protein [Limnohabitans sp.]